MRFTSLKALAVIFIAMMLVVLPVQADAIVSSTATVQLSYVVGESISISGAPPSLTFAGAPNPQTGALSVTTKWNLSPSRVRLDTNLFFSSITAAMTDGNGHNISPSNISANLDGGAFSACNTNPATEVAGVAVAGATCNAGFGGTTAALGFVGTHTSVFILQLDGATAAALPAGTYTGQLSLVAGAN